MNNLSPELQAKRDEQLKEYRASQQRMADYLKPAPSVVTKIPNKVYLDNLNRL
ncbi:hypothetical protein [Thiothrix nivea]|uniref:Uncharacterized protein n=1 Tax=Thiothrix nivea (strain ATCC 35100 / DSM 5205 / JP2) TaxID=870187 RepID=A0A656HIR5_THINJ|nr:hypothetical protein [Thiothrix nivea]EIJ35280.1 hypothetical protein Thini_2743 [Thiothrix nivea DSM 5205]